MIELPDVSFSDELLDTAQETPLENDWRFGLLIRAEREDGAIKYRDRLVAFMSNYWKRHHSSDDMKFQRLIFTLLYLYFTGQLSVSGGDPSEYDYDNESSDSDDIDNFDSLFG